MCFVRRTALLSLVVLATCARAPEGGAPGLEPLSVGTNVRLQAVSAVDDDVVWVSGLEGTFARSLDGGETWRVGVVDGAKELQFRDVHGVSSETAYLLSSGPGDTSRVFKTEDGGGSWALQLVNEEPEGFFDCFDFWDGERGLVYGDSVDGRIVVLTTADGESWRSLREGALPAAREEEGGFAASGTCVVTVGEATAFVGTGGGSARLIATHDGGRSFEAFDTPIASTTDTSGITALAFWDRDRGMIAGGDVGALDEHQSDVVAVTEDGGRSWRLASPPPFAGAIYGLARAPGAAHVVAVGPGGAAWTEDAGETWQPLSTESYWSAAFSSSRRGFMVGPEGRVTRIRLR